MKWKKIGIIAMCYVFLFAHFPVNVFAEINSASNEVYIKEDSEQLETEAVSSNTNEKEIDIWAIDENHSKMEYLGKESIDWDSIEVKDEVIIDNESYSLIHDQVNDIGWVLTESIELVEDEELSQELHKSNKSDLHENEAQENEEVIEETIASTSETKEPKVENEDTSSNETDIVEETNPDQEEYVNNEEKHSHSIEENTDSSSVADKSKVESQNIATSSSLMSSQAVKEESIKIISTQTVGYAAEVVKSWSINTQPWGTAGAEFVESAEKYVGKTIEVIQEKVTSRSTYALLKYGGKELGWFDKKGIEPHTVQDKVDVNYGAKIIKSWSVNTEPWGIRGFTPAVTTSSVGKEYTVTQEAKTPRSTYVLLTKNGQNIGWIDKNAVEKKLTVDSTENVSYAAEVIKSWSINTQPWGTAGADFVESAEKYVGKTIEVVQEKVTSRSTYALIKYGGKELGWIDVQGLNPHTIKKSINVNYGAKVIKNWSVNTEPWGIRGFKPALTTSIVGRDYTVTREVETPRSVYVLLTKNGKNIGWIDKSGVEEELTVLSTQNISYAAEVSKSWSINSLPYGIEGSSFVMSANDYVGKMVTINQEKTTPRSTYGLLEYGGEELGWFDIDGLKPHTIKKRVNVNYGAKVIKNWSVNTEPWGIRGFESAVSTSIVGKDYTVTQEVETPRSTYVLLTKNGQNVGWIDKGGVEEELTVLSTKNVSYAADVIKSWSINSRPWGTEGAKLVTNAKKYLHQSVEVIQEKTTSRSTYALIVVGGEEIGWIDIDGLKPHTIIKESNVKYDVTVVKDWSVNTMPWGVKGYKSSKETSIVGKDFSVIKEAVTPRSTYVLLTNNGKQLGWIDIDGTNKLKTVLSTTSTNYMAKVKKSWSINTKPHGTKDAVKVSTGANYLNKSVRVIQEKKTSRNTYALIQLAGATLGWIDKNALDSGKVVMIDPGHGGTDPGAHGILNGRRINEKDLNLSVSLKLRKILQSQGYTVLMTRDDDSTVQALDRGRLTNNSDADIFLSIHFNALPKTMANYSSVSGIESFFYKYNPKYPSKLLPDTHDNPYKLAEGYKLAHDIQDGLLSETGARHRRVDDAAFIVIKEVEVPAALTELGFLTNQQDLAKAVTESYQNKLAQGLANGINNYFNR